MNKQKLTKEEIELWKLWSECFYDAKRFFESKGNIKTRSKHKKTWRSNLMKNIKELKIDP